MEMAEKQSGRNFKGRVIFGFIMLIVWQTADGQIHYLIPEEMEKGTVVGNIAKDLGLSNLQLSECGVRILSRGRANYFSLGQKDCLLRIKERIDREQICEQTAQCLLNIEILVEEAVQLYAIEVEIQDINDNTPTFPADEIVLKISESAAPGVRYLLQDAKDQDVGMNSLQSYQLSTNKHFTLDVKTGANGVKNVELVLEKTLDREEKAVHHLILTASDGGDPVRSGTAQIRIFVLDANDNAPHFNQSIYRGTIRENAPKGTVAVTLNATDLDEEINSEVTYLFKKLTDAASQIFQLDARTGEISVVGNVDFEESEFYEIEVQANDGGDLSSTSKVVLHVIDVNDNAPDITITKLVSPLAEDSPPGTLIALLHVHDRDSGENGQVTCSIPKHFPFLLKQSFGTYHSLVTTATLDREEVSEYNITITARDKGSPPLYTTRTFSLVISDRNDNPPIFQQTSYTANVMENNPPAVSFFSVTATDRDWDQNAKVTYSIQGGNIPELRLSSYISINSETGVIYALRSFDYEQFCEFEIQVKAEDGGSPPQSANVTVFVFILDQNDNTPEILHPAPQGGGSSGVELAPRSSEAGYLVTKVVAVDADSGQNAWLSYQLLRATDSGLFTVGIHTGEIRTARPFLEKDAVKQTLSVLVKDNGHPPRSASATVIVMVADTIPEILSDIRSFSSPTDTESNLTLYLVIAVVSVSCLFFIFIIMLLVLRIHRWRDSQLYPNVNFNTVPASQYEAVDGLKAFLQTYSQEVFLAPDSRKDSLNFHNSSYPNTLTDNLMPIKEASALTQEALDISNPDQFFSKVSVLI
ncbi:protocadherin gamma-A12-like [Rhinatrema bivittatum]|uniref:protocadherin gamma-A12-like n=1 Tax=Rhinatrema bivittatum TaxID=194408 RepID=UPI00112C80DB|nr:protocadherin gamma-A12-like [Rhinatrema bivittatum]